jgi:predicted PurR-regulated permease PerM
MFQTVDRNRAVWWAVAAVLGLVVLFVLYAFVGTFVLGLFLYYAARPVYVRIRGPLRSPGLAATVSLFALALPVVLLFAYTLSLAIRQLQTVLSGDLSEYTGILEPILGAAGAAEQFGTQFESLLSDPASVLVGSGAQNTILSLLGPFAEYLGATLNALVHVFIAIALAYYLLKDGDALAAWVWRHFGDTQLDEYGGAVDRDLQTIYFGNILNAFLTGVVGAVVFYALALVAPQAVPLPVPILLGLLTGLGSLVPVVGMKIVYLPMTAYLFALALLAEPGVLWFPILFFVITFVVVDTIPDIVLRPYVSGRNLHIGSVMFSYIFGSLLFGWYGIFLGPLLLVVLMDFGRVVVPELT